MPAGSTTYSNIIDDFTTSSIVMMMMMISETELYDVDVGITMTIVWLHFEMIFLNWFMNCFLINIFCVATVANNRKNNTQKEICFFLLLQFCFHILHFSTQHT